MGIIIARIYRNSATNDFISNIVQTETGDIKASIAALTFILSCAAKYDVDAETLSNELQQLGLPKGECDILPMDEQLFPYFGTFLTSSDIDYMQIWPYLFLVGILFSMLTRQVLKRLLGFIKEIYSTDLNVSKNLLEQLKHLTLY